MVILGNGGGGIEGFMVRNQSFFSVMNQRIKVYALWTISPLPQLLNSAFVMQNSHKHM